MVNPLKQKLYDVISGKSEVSHGRVIQTIASYLGGGSQTSEESESTKSVKEQEREKLEPYSDSNSLWAPEIDFTQYVSEGAEQKVYLNSPSHVLKLNDAIYYSSWRDYFINLLLHNFFFPDTAYEFIGFIKENETLFALVKQTFVKETTGTNLNQVKTFLLENGFTNNRNNDYINIEVGIILEDLHDENVLTCNGLLYFIDTVFYLKPEFWSET